MTDRTITGSQLLEALRAGGIDTEANKIYVEQTGGGTATIYGGPDVDYDGDPNPAFMIGPGTFDWEAAGDSVFFGGDLYVGPGWDDQASVAVDLDYFESVVDYVKAILHDAADHLYVEPEPTPPTEPNWPPANLSAEDELIFWKCAYLDLAESVGIDPLEYNEQPGY